MTPDIWQEALRTLAAHGIRGPELAELCVLLSGLRIPPGLAVWRDVETRLQLGSAKLDPVTQRRREYLARAVSDGPALGLALWILARAIDGGDLEARSAVEGIVWEQFDRTGTVTATRGKREAFVIPWENGLCRMQVHVPGKRMRFLRNLRPLEEAKKIAEKWLFEEDAPT